MRDYLPLDLSRFVNTGARVLGKKERVHAQGIPH